MRREYTRSRRLTVPTSSPAAAEAIAELCRSGGYHATVSGRVVHTDATPDDIAALIENA